MAVRDFGAVGAERVYEATIAGGGATAKIITFGAVVRDLVVPAPTGQQRVVLGLERIEDYVAHSPHFGAIAGRVANRIGHGRFVLDGREYNTTRNMQGRHTLHGGAQGFGKRVWQLVAHDAASATLAIVGRDGEEGFPGEITATAKYTLTPAATLRVEMWAFADAPTHVNLAHHSYFNLDGGADILDHVLELPCPSITPVDADLIPTGEVKAIAGTAYDFQKARRIRLADPSGTRVWYDHNYVLKADRREAAVGGLTLAHAATLSSERSRLAMEVWSTEPAVQFYDGAKIAVPVPGLDGARYGANAGLCLEPQLFPNAANIAHFPSTVLRPGGLYRQVSEFRFRAM